MKRFLTAALIILIVASFSSTSFAADTKVNGRLYADWTLNTTDGADSYNAFSVSRAYVTVKSKLSDYTSVRVTTDIRSIDGFDGYNIILKYGYLDYKPKFGNGNFKFRFGLQPTPYIDQMNKFWGRRYLSKTTGDLNKFLTTSDLGAGFIFNLGEKGKVGSVQVNVFNGSSYSHTTDENKNKDISGFIQLKPFVNNERN